jgi:hypothetical protein
LWFHYTRRSEQVFLTSIFSEKNFHHDQEKLRHMRLVLPKYQVSLDFGGVSDYLSKKNLCAQLSHGQKWYRRLSKPHLLFGADKYCQECGQEYK